MTPQATSIIRDLRGRGVRITPVRHEIVEILAKTKRPLSADELGKLLKKRGISAYKTTIYRQIDELLERGVLQEVRFAERLKRYELALAHHHHLVCLSCGNVADVELPENLKKQEKNIAKKHRFIVEYHSLEFFGYCRNCLRNGA